MLLRLIKKTPNLFFIEKRKIFYSISFFLALISLIALMLKGLNFGIDFKGGLLIEAKFKEDTNLETLRNKIAEVNKGDFSIQALDNSNNNYLIKVELNETIDNDQEELINLIKNSFKKQFGGQIDYRRVEYVGPTVSKELVYTGIIAIIVAIISMLIYIWFRFELPFALGAVIALVHDTVLTVGMFSLTSLEFNLSTIN